MGLVKRDFDLIRAILFKVEAAPPGTHLRKRDLHTDEIDDGTMVMHVVMLQEAGFLDCWKSREVVGSGIPVDVEIKRLTWAGHEYLDGIRHDTVWAKIKTTALSKGAALTFEVVKALSSAIVKDQLQLP